MRRWPLLALATLTAAVAATSSALAATSGTSAQPAPMTGSAAPVGVAQHSAEASATSSGATVVSFSYAPQVLVQLDASGRPWRVKTNTGNPPASTDQLDVADASGAPISATMQLQAAVAAAAWSGDWSAVGAWHAWPTSG